MITDDEVEKSVHFLRDNARNIARAKSTAEYMADFTKVVKSKIMRENPTLPIGTQEAIAQADPRFEQHLDAKRIADEDYEYQRWMMEAADAKIRAWQTQSSNNRKGL